MSRTLSDIINNEALEYAMYTIENRALPNGIDGLKPVQRFVLYSVIKDARNSFDKVAALGSTVAKLGYKHGEVSAQDALALMAADWKTNIPIIQGRGNLGSRMVQESASARYVYAKLHDDFDLYYKDIELSPEHDDPEHIPPAFYIPVLPMVLANGIQGVATGYACKILPHDPQWMLDAVKSCLANSEIPEPVVKFPCFNGKIIKETALKYSQLGTFTKSGLTVTITEIPTTYDHAGYIKVLDSLVDKGTISSYTDETSSEFKFVVKCKRGTKMEDESLIKMLKLRSSFTQNLNVIDENGKIRSFNDVRELVKWFVEFRLAFLPTRIENQIQRTTDVYNIATAKVLFINKVIDGSITLIGKTRKEVAKTLSEYECFKEHVDVLLRLSVDKLTTDEIAVLEKQADDAKKELSYWENTTPLAEYKSDLKKIK